MHWLLGLCRRGARRLRARLRPSAVLRGVAVHRPRPWRFVPPVGSFTRKVVCPYIHVTELSGDAGTDPPGPVGFMGNGLARPRDTAGQAGLCWRPKAMSLGPVLTVLPCTPATPQPRSRGADSALMPSWPLGPLAGLCTWPHRAQSGWTAPPRADVAARPSVWSGQASNMAYVSSLRVWDEHDPLPSLIWRWAAVISAALFVAVRACSCSGGSLSRALQPSAPRAGSGVCSDSSSQCTAFNTCLSGWCPCPPAVPFLSALSVLAGGRESRFL